MVQARRLLALNPLDLNIKGATQPEVFRGRVDLIVQALIEDPARFWQECLDKDDLIEIWVINGERYLFDGVHRYYAAIEAGEEIPDFVIDTKDETGSNIPTFRLDLLDWMPGVQ